MSIKLHPFQSATTTLNLPTTEIPMSHTMIMGILLSFLVLPLGAADLQSPIVSNSITQTGSTPCDVLSSVGLGERILLPTCSLYSERIKSYWSVSAQLRPWCIFHPHTASEISTALIALSKTTDGAGDWHVAVRGGGHSTWPGINNVNNGVTIDLGYLNTSWYDKTTGLASVSPGGRWVDVASDLMEYQVVVAGGRDGGVGVGGFLTGG